MTQSLALAGLARAVANSKPHHYKQNVPKNERHFENMGFNGKQFEDFRRKKTRLLASPKQPQETHTKCSN